MKLASERFLYALWDLKLEVGYGVRDLEACDQLASEDHTARTALLDLRYLAGDRELFRELEREELHGLSQAKVEKFLADKLEEMRARRERFGDSLYLLEPNVKESEGGLRDLQSALWLARVRFKVAGHHRAARAGAPPRARDPGDAAGARLPLARPERDALPRRPQVGPAHLRRPAAGGARRWGTATASSGSAVEEFMRHYYLAAKTVLVACDAIVDRCLEPQSRDGLAHGAAARGDHRRGAAGAGAARAAAARGGPPPARRRAQGLPRAGCRSSDKDVLRRSPAALVRLFATADRERLDLYPYARDLAAQAAEELPPRRRRPTRS